MIDFKTRLVFLLVLAVECLYCSIVMDRPINRRMHDELLAQMFPTFESSVYNLRALYSCADHNQQQRRQNTPPPRCCSCDAPSCHLRKDCCFDVDFIANPMPWEVYIEYLVANRQDHHNNGSCFPVSKSMKKRGWKTQFVYARNKCKDGSNCVDPSFGRMVVGRASGQFYTNELCAICNLESDFRYPKLKIQLLEDFYKVAVGANEMLNLGELLVNKNNNITVDTESSITISLQPSEKTALDCPYGELARPDKAYSKCTRLEYELCLTYVAAVSDSRYGYAANPHCVKCMPFHAKPKLDVLKCDSLRRTRWSNISSPVELLIETNTSHAVLVFRSNTTREVRSQTVRMCSSSTTTTTIDSEEKFDVETLACHSKNFFQQFLINPTLNNSNITNSNQTNQTGQPGGTGTLLFTEDVSFDEFLDTFHSFLGVWYPLLIPASLISTVLVMVTFATIKGLHHPPGAWLLMITALLFFYFLLQLICVFYRVPPPRLRTYVPLLNHWCVLTKHAFLCMLSYELFVVYSGRKQAVQNVVVRVVATCIATAAAIIVCGWKDAFVRYGDCLILSLNGRMFVYWLPLVTLSFGSMFSLRVLRLNIKQNTSAAADDFQPEQEVDDLLLMKAVNAAFRFNLIAIIIDTLAAVRFDVNSGNRELYQLFNASARLLFCTLNGLQGVLLLVMFIKRKFILMTYRKKITRSVRKLTDLFCCDFCFRYDEHYVYSEEQTLNTTRETIALSTTRSSFV